MGITMHFVATINTFAVYLWMTQKKNKKPIIQMYILYLHENYTFIFLN